MGVATQGLMPSHDVAVHKVETEHSQQPLFSIPLGLDHDAVNTASRILHIIHRYRLNKGPDVHNLSDESSLRFLTLIYTHVKAQKPIPMCLPAFPFKSPNSTRKVLGKLPDKAEELALSHLNGLCLAIGDVYSPGAHLTIISDGLVYNGESLPGDDVPCTCS